MKRFNFSLMLVAVLALSLGFTSCDDDEDAKPKTNNIVDVASANPDLSMLVEALTKANLVSTLSGPEDYTVFAPTNAAFTAYLVDKKISSLKDVPVDQLKEILLYHVLEGKKKSSDLTTGYYANYIDKSTPLLYSAYFNKDNSKLNDEAKIVKADINADNGVIHTIDKVIEPLNIVTIASNDPQFSILVQALLKAELAVTLQGEGPFTVFAPTNSAFEALFTELKVKSINDLSKDDLTPILKAHVLPGNIRSSALKTEKVQTLNAGKKLDVDVTRGVTIDGNIKVVVADVQGTNGIIHAIDKVISLD